MMRNDRMNSWTRAVFRSYPLISVALMASLALTNTGYFKSVLAESRQQALIVTPSFAEGQSVSSGEAIELQLSRFPEKGEGRIGVFIGSSDLTSLFTQVETRFIYTANILPLPLGESMLTVYLISPSQAWQEIARFPINISNEKPSKRASGDEPKTEKSPAAPEQKPEQKREEQLTPSEKRKDQEPTSKPDDKQKSAEQKAESSGKKPEGDAKDPEAKPAEQSATQDKPKTEEANKAGQPASENKPEQAADAAQQPSGGAAQAQPQAPARKLGFDKLNLIPWVT